MNWRTKALAVRRGKSILDRIESKDREPEMFVSFRNRKNTIYSEYNGRENGGRWVAFSEPSSDSNSLVFQIVNFQGEQSKKESSILYLRNSPEEESKDLLLFQPLACDL